MARGLSELQKCILSLAYQKQDEKVRYREILTRYYGWQPRSWGSYGHCFSRQKIGVKKYSSAMAAVSKACTRLRARGLVECYMNVCRESAVQITEAGKELMANTRTKWSSISH